MKVLLNAVNLLSQATDSYDVELVAAATGHIASLLRLKSSGVARGFVTIGVVNSLCNVMESPLMSETGRDAAACALSTLTNIPDACRLILKELRLRPFIGFILAEYTPIDKTSYEYRTRWNKMKTMHLPDITEDQKNIMKNIKTHDRRKALVETNITWNRVRLSSFARNLTSQSKALMASFANHLRSPSGRSSRARTGSSKSKDGRSSKISRYRFCIL